MENFLLILGAIGSVASLLALWQAASTLRAKIAHLLYACIIAATVYFSTTYKNELNAIKSAAREATSLIENRRMNFTDEGYINAALSFLEKHKSEFPDTYERAKLICEKNGCFESKNKRSDTLQHAWDQIAVASAMDGILKGIANTSRSN